MKLITRYFFILPAFILAPAFLSAQPVDTLVLKNYRAPQNRILYHDLVAAEQRNILKFDGKADYFLEISDNPEINYFLTRTARWDIRSILYKIENDTSLGHSAKVRYVQGLKELLQQILKGWKSKEYSPVSLPATIGAYEYCMQLDKKGASFELFFDKLEWEVAAPLTRTIGLENNPGIKTCRMLLVKKYCILHPEKIFHTLTFNPDVPFADSLIRTVARKNPDELYNYAAANNRLGTLIRNIQDDIFIKTVSKMARSKSGRLQFPFLDNIVNGKITFEEIDAIKDDSVAYYKLMVKTQMDYVSRAINKDTAFGFKDLTEMLHKKAESVFINTINGLHEIDNPAIRFAIIQQLNAQELYYAAVLTDGIIYTSSFTKGVYPLMMQKINQRGDSLLELVKFDKYRKFIKMAAGYNTLGNFLNTFSKTAAEDRAKILMRAFVSNLEKSDSLEDGVDVADSYASIAETMKPVAEEMLQNIKLNYRKNVDRFNKSNDNTSQRGMTIYNILEKLFLSADSTKNIDLTKELGIPPVYNIPYSNLTNDSGRVIMQVFFYGEKSDMGIFNDFVSMFRNANWKIEANPLWVSIHSVKGKPLSIYANRALPQETGEDEKAQAALCEYLEKNKIYPTVTIHRGHSYTAPYTIQQMSPSTKIVFLGSCGGYHLIHDVLEKATDAHIIASKQIGRTVINRPFMRLITEKARNGSNVDWIPFWKEFKKEANVPEFDDYIPPYKNLGAIYIKAFKISSEKSEKQKTAFNSLNGN